MNKFNKKIGIGELSLLLCIIVVFLFGCTGMQTNKDKVSPEIVSEYEISSTGEKVNEEIDYLNSQDSVELQIAAQSFAKSYFSGDYEGVKLYLADVNTAKVYEKNIYDELEYFILKWSPKDIATKTTIDVQYQFLVKGADSADYLGILMNKISNEWKVTDFYIEK